MTNDLVLKVPSPTQVPKSLKKKKKNTKHQKLLAVSVDTDLEINPFSPFFPAGFAILGSHGFLYWALGPLRPREQSTEPTPFQVTFPIKFLKLCL